MVMGSLVWLKARDTAGFSSLKRKRRMAVEWYERLMCYEKNMAYFKDIC